MGNLQMDLTTAPSFDSGLLEYFYITSNPFSIVSSFLWFYLFKNKSGKSNFFHIWHFVKLNSYDIPMETLERGY